MIRKEELWERLNRAQESLDKMVSGLPEVLRDARERLERDHAAQLKERDALLDEAMRLLYLFDEGVGHLPEVGPLEIIALRARIEEARK